MIFFDLEFYVPPQERFLPNTKGTLVLNPARPSNILLGGHFIAQGFKDPKPRQEKAFWLWKSQDDEKNLLTQIAGFFHEEWLHQQAEEYKIMNKRIDDIVTCGFAVGRVDLPALYIRSQLLNVKPIEELYTTFLKTRVIDLSQVACFLFPKEKHFYPKTANEVAHKLLPKSAWKASGKDVWMMFDEGDYNAIEKRCHDEVHTCIQIYHLLQEKLDLCKQK